ncbi:hypothetical protein ILYODFUR_001683, partial [Ilyodon furcidens]
YHYPVPKIFYVQLSVGSREFIGEGRTRQAARHNAAMKALQALRNEPIPERPPQMELDEVVHAWNDHRIRSTNNPRAPNGRPTLMHVVPNLYGVPNFLQPASQTELEICLEECLFKDFPCDVDVFHLCTELMTQHILVMSDDVYEITNLYVRLRQMISDGLGE